MENTFFTWNDFTKKFTREVSVAEEVFDQMTKSGLKDHCLTRIDFTFISDKEENLVKLKSFISTHYQYRFDEIKETDESWQLNGITNEIPLTKDNLIYWVLDMFKRGYEFDSVIDAYGGFADTKDQMFPELSLDKILKYYNHGIDCYTNGDLSGAIFNFSLVISISPDDQDAYYSRAVVKNELYAWKAALKDYNRAIEIDPNFISALLNRGTVKDENRDYSGARQDYEKVLGLEGVEIEDLQKAYFNLGNTKFNMNNNKGACEDWAKALKLGAEYAEENIINNCC